MNTMEPIRDKETIIDIAEYLRKNSERNYVMFLFGIYSGLRISDVLKFRVRDVKNKSDIVLREKKTGKEKRFPINRDLRKALDHYIAGKDDYEFLFANPRSSKPITRQQAYNIISDAGKKFGVENIWVSRIPVYKRCGHADGYFQPCRYSYHLAIHWS